MNRNLDKYRKARQNYGKYMNKGTDGSINKTNKLVHKCGKYEKMKNIYL